MPEESPRAGQVLRSSGRSFVHPGACLAFVFRVGTLGNAEPAGRDVRNCPQSIRSRRVRHRQPLTPLPPVRRARDEPQAVGRLNNHRCSQQSIGVHCHRLIGMRLGSPSRSLGHFASPTFRVIQQLKHNHTARPAWAGITGRTQSLQIGWGSARIHSEITRGHVRPRRCSTRFRPWSSSAGCPYCSRSR